MIPEFDMPVQAGDGIILAAKASAVDGAYLQSTLGKPLLPTTVVYNQFI